MVMLCYYYEVIRAGEPVAFARSADYRYIIDINGGAKYLYHEETWVNA